MRWLILIACVAVAGCDVAVPTGAPMADVRAVISTRDIAMNRPNTTTREALFRMRADGTGTVEFIANPDGAQDVAWTLQGDRFCIAADEGLMASFECATLSLDGAQVTFAHTQSGNVATGVLMPR
ncbi:hypothetical protein L0664_15610 [Octadecabacter sp. G9-8]|uniref:Lipoprotein n=1 Tax=Octadecabacter dasysiphoniae TaxID=2909341 RepID=A0ABS9CZ01_9RHOB|nr:hypothetical protein [Octadecabacter dasysiphoniae]MCF2872502.1 hypothetical protein [Octadecabacter dasysiphoniae]